MNSLELGPPALFELAEGYAIGVLQQLVRQRRLHQLDHLQRQLSSQ
jgi:hypothetical protein